MAESNFPGQRPPNWQPPQGTAPAKRGCGFWLLIGVGVIVGLGVIGSLADKGGQPPAPSAPASPQAGAAAPVAGEAAPQANVVTPEQLRAAYERNEVAAQEQYGAKFLRMTGVLHSIELDLTDDPTLSFETGQPYEQVNVNLAEGQKDAAMKLGKGEKATVLCGKISEVLGTPVLGDCTIEP